MRDDPLVTYINFARLIVERDRRIHREVMMTIEIKGLGANVEAARAAIRRARAATAHMNEAGGTLERTANEIAAVFEQHTSDLLREANTLGNGSSESEMQSPQVAAAPEVPAAKPTFPGVQGGIDGAAA